MDVSGKTEKTFFFSSLGDLGALTHPSTRRGPFRRLITQHGPFEAASPIGLGLPPLELDRDLEGFKGAPLYSNGRLASTQIGVITSPQSQFHLEIPGLPSYPQAPFWNLNVGCERNELI